MTTTRARALLIVGLVLMVAGIIDPLEGSLVILIGSATTAIGAGLGRLPGARAVIVAFVIMVLGIAALWGFSAAGGIGGTSGRTIWWGLTMLPYPIGWLAAMTATIISLRASRHATA